MENNDMQKNYVFVYGTLKKGRQNHHKFENAGMLVGFVNEYKILTNDSFYWRGNFQ